jgi:hypothetical protein
VGKYLDCTEDQKKEVAKFLGEFLEPLAKQAMKKVKPSSEEIQIMCGGMALGIVMMMDPKVGGSLPALVDSFAGAVTED